MKLISNDKTEMERKSPVSYSGGNFLGLNVARRMPVNLIELQRMWHNEGVTHRAIRKRARDLVGGEIHVKLAEDTGEENPDSLTVIAKELENFLDRHSLMFKKKFRLGSENGMALGNGFLEIIYSNDTADAIDESNGDDIERFGVIDSTMTVIVEEDRRILDDKPNPDYGEVVGYWVYNNGRVAPYQKIAASKAQLLLGNGVMLHPSRVLQFAFDFIGDENVGVSLISGQSAKNIIQSKIRADAVIGTILVNYAKPIIKGIIADGQPDEIHDLYKKIAKVNDNDKDIAQIVTDDSADISFMQGNTGVIRPQDYYKVLIDNIAINIGVPRVLLIGAEQGSISGSDLNLVSYFQDLVTDGQDSINPLIGKLFSEYLRVTGRDPAVLDVLRIEQDQPYADEIAMFKAILMNTQAAVQSYRSGLITLNEARRQMSMDPIGPEGDEYFQGEAGDDLPEDFPAVDDIEDQIRGAVSNLPGSRE